MSNAAQTLYTASMAYGVITTANSNLDGTGSVITVITGGASGTFVKSLIIKSQVTTSVGMIRIYTTTTASTNLLMEIYVPPVVISGRDASFTQVIPLNYTLASGEVLAASTQVGNTFNVIAEAFDISYTTTTSFLGSTVEYVANAGSNKVTTANVKLDGTGATVAILTAGTSATYKGCVITSIKIKAQQTTNPGMVRLYITDASGSNPPVLFNEVEVPAMVQGATTKTFGCEAIAGGSLCIPADWSIYASTQLGETFSILIEAQDWKNV